MVPRERGWRRLAGLAAVGLSGALLACLGALGSGAHAATARTPTRPDATVATPLLETGTTTLPSPRLRRGADAGATNAQTATDTTPQAVTVQVSSTPSSGPLPAGFLGFSVEYSALAAYLGRNPNRLNPVFLQLLEGIDQGHAPVLRVGGNSTDDTWSPLPGVIAPPAVSYGLTGDWIATVHALVRATGARLILGVNLAADDPQMASVIGRELVNGIGRRSIEDLEIGNEPDLYLRNGWYQSPTGAVVTRRTGGYSFNSYTANFAHWSALLPDVPLATGALATLGWLPQLSPIADRFRRVSLLTTHRYALTNCGVAPSSPLYPTIPNLLSAAATSGLAAPLTQYAQEVHAEGLNFRVDELNSASCEGAPGVSDSFASALWITDELFDMAQAGVDGVNIHTLPGASYAPFSFSDVGGAWVASVQPLYYGLLFFADAFPPGAELLSSSDSSADIGGDVKAFSTETPDGTLRTTLINEDPSEPADVQLTLPTTNPLTVETLTAPSLASTSGVTIGGRGFADPTTTGVLSTPAQTTELDATGDSYGVVVAPGSAVLLTSTG